MKHGRLEWDIDGLDWPHRSASRFVTAGGMRWHVQLEGHGPAVLLLHGTGAASHSWRHLMPLLTSRYTVIVPDLPGHGFSSPPARHDYSLEGYARGIAALLAELRVSPAIVAGNSAGAAVAVRYALDTARPPARIIGINAALLPLAGLSGWLFPPLARIAAASPFVAHVVARSARDPRAVERMIEGTGSRLEPAGIALYRKLLASPAHVEAVLRMMSQWRLERFAGELGRLQAPLLLVTGLADRIVPPVTAESVRRLVPHTRLAEIPRRGHLVHEEDAAAVADFFLAGTD